MMEAAHLGYGDRATPRRRLDVPADGVFLMEREVRARAVVGTEVALENPAEVILAEYDHMVQALSPDSANHPLRKRVPPRRFSACDDLTEAHVSNTAPEVVSVNPVPISNEEPRDRAVARECFDDLMGSPLGHVVPL